MPKLTPQNTQNTTNKQDASATADKAPAPPRAWQRMLSGAKLDLLSPDPRDIEISDIAHGLARVARWNGQTVGEHAFSVAQHSLIVSEIALALAQCEAPADTPPQAMDARTGAPCILVRAALLHDAPEYVIGDLISPFKVAIGDDYKIIEHRLLTAIHTRFGVPTPLPQRLQAFIKTADRIAAFYEATRLAGFEITEARHLFGTPPNLPQSLHDHLMALKPWPTDRAQNELLEKFKSHDY